MKPTSCPQGLMEQAKLSEMGWVDDAYVDPCEPETIHIVELEESDSERIICHESLHAVLNRLGFIEASRGIDRMGRCLQDRLIGQVCQHGR